MAGNGVPTDKDLAGTVADLLLHAGISLGTDLFAAKVFIDQAAAILDWRCEQQSVVAPLDGSGLRALAPWQINRLVSFVTHNIGSSIRNSDMAQVVKLSTSYFSTAFRGSFGVSPQRYVVRRRVQRAKDLMFSTRHPLAQIALTCGFVDQANFSKIFLRETCMRPSQWRRAHGECAAGLQATPLLGGREIPQSS
jgi:transcriptional regulator GlxA family with amidase domain